MRLFGDDLFLAYHESMSRFVIAVLILALATPLAAADEESTEIPVFPDIKMSTLDGSGEVGLADFRGRPVLLSFWASWCGPCRIELPELQELYKELAGDGFVLLTINVDAAPEFANRFLAQLGISVPVYRMGQRDLVELGVSALPTNILLDHEGRPVHIYTGYSPTLPQEIRRLVEEMSAEESRPS
jgi:thiol-disulfide isomerase/thioredoxin